MRPSRAATRPPFLATSAVIAAALSWVPSYGYVIARLTVSLPPVPIPLVRPLFDWSLARQDVLDRFSAVMTPLAAEQTEIFDACFYGWRLPTEAEQVRLDEIMARCDIESALVERTLSGIQ